MYDIHLDGLRTNTKNFNQYRSAFRPSFESGGIKWTSSVSKALSQYVGGVIEENHETFLWISNPRP
jgi:hypothetical protein